ncbi:hypothetical protein Tco_1333307 [Tanacetum coccineum]
MRLLPHTDDSEKYFVAHIFYLLRKEETYNGQVKLTEWILQMQNAVVLYCFMAESSSNRRANYCYSRHSNQAFFALPSARIEVLMFAALWRGCILLSLSVYGDILVYTNWSQCTLMIQKYDDPHENTQERSTTAGRPSLRRVRRPTATARNRRRPTVMCGGEEGSRLANRILLASQNFLLSFVLVSQVRTNPDYQSKQPLICLESSKYRKNENFPSALKKRNDGTYIE